MKAVCCLFLFVSLALCQQTSKPPFKLVIAAEDSAVVAGNDVSIKVSLTNTSDKDVYEGIMYRFSDIDTCFQFDVRDAQGKLVPKRIYPHPELATGSVRFRTIKVGETIVEPQTVSDVYDMRQPGKYTIQVFRKMSEDPKDDIKSNTVTITVTSK